MQQKKIIKINI